MSVIPQSQLRGYVLTQACMKAGAPPFTPGTARAAAHELLLKGGSTIGEFMRVKGRGLAKPNKFGAYRTKHEAFVLIYQVSLRVTGKPARCQRGVYSYEPD